MNYEFINGKKLKKLKDYIIHFLNLFSDLNLIHKSLPPNSYLINVKPYIIVEK